MALETLSYYVNARGQYICVKNCPSSPTVYVPSIGLEIAVDEAITTAEAVVWNLLRVTNPRQAQNIAGTAIGKAAFDAATNPSAVVLERLGLNDAGDAGRGNSTTKAALDSALTAQFPSYAQACADCSATGQLAGLYSAILGTAETTNINFFPPPSSGQQITEITEVNFTVAIDGGGTYQTGTAEFKPPLSAANPSGGAGGYEQNVFGLEALDVSATFDGNGFFTSAVVTGSNVAPDARGFDVTQLLEFEVITNGCGAGQRIIQQ